MNLRQLMTPGPRLKRVRSSTLKGLLVCIIAPAAIAATVLSLTQSQALARPGGGPNGARAHRNYYRVPFIPANDVQYIDAIVPHHEHALEMAEMELEKGTRPEVQAIAQRMKEMQMQEIQLLLAARQQLTGHAQVPRAPRDPHNEKDMRELEAATGAAVDSLFIRDMIPHHAEGISIAHRALPNLQRPDLIQNARDVIRAQAMEIGELQALRTDENY